MHLFQTVRHRQHLALVLEAVMHPRRLTLQQQLALRQVTIIWESLQLQDVYKRQVQADIKLNGGIESGFYKMKNKYGITDDGLVNAISFGSALLYHDDSSDDRTSGLSLIHI